METRVSLLNWGGSRLRQHKLDNCRREAELILASLEGCSPCKLYLDDCTVEDANRERFVNLIEQRLKRFPLQYLLKNVEFMGLNFTLAPGVFIPRPETEILALAAIFILQNNFSKGLKLGISWKEIFNEESLNNLMRLIQYNPHPRVNRLKILDLGTGCGNIAISLTGHVSDCKIIASDFSFFSITLASRNAQLNQVSEEILFVQSNLFSGLKQREALDMIISNPPYIPQKELARLPAELNYEPRAALDGGEDGLNFYRRIARETFKYLTCGGYLVMEIGAGQAQAIKEILTATKIYAQPVFIKDLNNIERVVLTRKI